MERLKTAAVLLALATFCALAHLWIVSWIVHSFGHGYKWITVLMGCVWVAVFALLALNMNLNRLRERADEADLEAHRWGRG